MTSSSSGLVAYVWDTSSLLHVSIAGRLDVLGEFVKPSTQESWEHCVTAAVAEELVTNGQSAPDWASLVHVDGLNEIVAFGIWCQRLVGADPHNRGEASVAAWAESHNAIAIVDDKDARIVMQRNGLTAHGSLWMLCQVINCGRINVRTASGFVDAVIMAGARLPFNAGGFED